MIKKREYNHMQSIREPVREVCPKTGQYIAPREISKLLTVRHFLESRTSTLPHPLDKYREMGAEHLTDSQIESAYNIIKEYKSCRILN